jgi:hypothetical protein
LLAEKTLEIRRKIVKIVAPKLYEDYYGMWESINKVPRPMTLFLKERSKAELVGVEIGVASGRNARSMLEELPIKRLWLIDPYNSEDGSSSKEDAVKSLSKFGQVVFVFKPSEEAVESMGIVDFVYIDGNHDYSAVQKDIELYYPCIEAGGVIGGHDFTVYYPGVVKAANEFAEKHACTLGVNFFIRPPDWWIIKT